MMTLANKSLPTPDIIRNLGLRFRDYRMRLMMTRKEVSLAARVGMTTLYKFESGNMTDISFGTVIRLLRAIGMVENWDALLPELPESPYMYDDNDKKIQRYSCNLYYYRNDKTLNMFYLIIRSCAE